MSRTPAPMIVASLLLLSFVTQVFGAGEAVPDSAIGLRKAGALETPTPEPQLANSTFPGEAVPPGAPFPGGPPPVSHATVDFLPITLERNDCVDCHAVEEKIEGEATPIPVSHYTDLRRDPSSRREEIVGARYNCSSCHVALGNNPMLVENGFGKAQGVR